MSLKYISLGFRELLGAFAVFILKSIRCIPFSITYSSLKILIPFYYKTRPQHIASVKRKIDSSPFSKELTLNQYYQHRLQLLLNNIYWHGQPHLPPQSKILNEHYLEKALQVNCPLVILSLHMGPFELLHKGAYQKTKKAHRPYYVLTAKAFSKTLTQYMNSGRETEGKKTVLNRKIGSSLKKIIQQNGVLAMMVDQSPLRDHESLTLWGTHTLPFNDKLLSLLLNKGAILLPLSCYQKGKTTVLTYHEPIAKPHLKTKITEFLEKEIAQAPAQWNWSYGGIKVKS